MKRGWWGLPALGQGGGPGEFWLCPGTTASLPSSSSSLQLPVDVWRCGIMSWAQPWGPGMRRREKIRSKMQENKAEQGRTSCHALRWCLQVPGPAGGAWGAQVTLPGPCAVSPRALVALWGAGGDTELGDSISGQRPQNEPPAAHFPKVPGKGTEAKLQGRARRQIWRDPLLLPPARPPPVHRPALPLSILDAAGDNSMDVGC